MLLRGLEREFQNESEGFRLRRAFRAWKLEYDCFEPFWEPDDLIAFMRDKSLGYEEKNKIILALCALSRKDDISAKLLLIKLFLPSLQQTLRSFAGNRYLVGEDLEIEIVEGFWEAVAAMPKDAEKPAGKLKWGARERAADKIKEVQAKHAAEDSIEATSWQDNEIPAGILKAITAPESTRQAEIRSGFDETVLLDRAVEEGVINHFESAAIFLTRYCEVSLADLAKCLDMDRQALKMRRHRGEGALADWLKGKDVRARRKISSRV